MTHPAISIRGLSKSYKIMHGTLKSPTFRDMIVDRVKHPFRRLEAETFWALQDVTLDINHGDVVGIIGRNGAGKSTLLKILSQITEPTTGRIEMFGRVGSLLEVGTGFHPELTGRENIFLNGAILGMTQGEIRRQFDAIVEFAGVEQFLDTPVKRFSSGMYVRLAFAVAAHLNPEILIVDEVLAVGDAEFQRKCLGKMTEVARGGRTVLFVSHNMAAIRTLCNHLVLLKSGRVASTGSVDQVIAEYLAEPLSEGSLSQRVDRAGDGRLRFTDVRLLDEEGRPVSEVQSGMEVTVEAEYAATESIDSKRTILSFTLYDDLKNVVALFATDEMPAELDAFGDRGVIRLRVPRMLLRAGLYSLRLRAGHLTTSADNCLDDIHDAMSLRVLPGDFWGTGKTNRQGNYCLIPAEFSN